MPISDLPTLLANLQPVLQPGRYVFATVPAGLALDPADVVASIREPEGWSVVVGEDVASAHGLPVGFTAAWIMLTVDSDLAAVGLTAAVARALAAASIACNVIAGTQHDHLFVPVGRSDDAIAVLRRLSAGAR